MPLYRKHKNRALEILDAWAEGKTSNDEVKDSLQTVIETFEEERSNRKRWTQLPNYGLGGCIKWMVATLKFQEGNGAGGSSGGCTERLVAA